MKDLIDDPSKIDQDKMQKIKLINSVAERFVYDNKIDKIANFEDFIKEMLADLMSAAKYNLSLFVDAFFFRANPVNNLMDYKVADFDGIMYTKDSNITVQELFAANKDHFDTALREFILYFVAEQEQDHYIKMIDKLLP
ncbi:hypothetical protein [Chryseobacterium profundimaris]|uniref:hypothetical protein n=1 Tax=Chryseobacterium profundimaris TaxID=1387275 RepID=UPI0024B65DA6|nr:hypothetical protein [Chryseobacterium profundimaris]